jgi:hypothetical protein
MASSGSELHESDTPTAQRDRWDLAVLIAIALLGLLAAWVTFGVLDSSAEGDVREITVGGAIAGAVVPNMSCLVGLTGQNANQCNALLSEVANATSPRVPRPRTTQRRLARLTDDDVAALVADYVAGLSVNELADIHHVHRTTIVRHLKQHGVQTRPRI